MADLDFRFPPPTKPTEPTKPEIDEIDDPGLNLLPQHRGANAQFDHPSHKK